MRYSSDHIIDELLDSDVGRNEGDHSDAIATEESKCTKNDSLLDEKNLSKNYDWLTNQRCWKCCLEDILILQTKVSLRGFIWMSDTNWRMFKSQRARFQVHGSSRVRHSKDKNHWGHCIIWSFMLRLRWIFQKKRWIKMTCVNWRLILASAYFQVGWVAWGDWWC